MNNIKEKEELPIVIDLNSKEVTAVGYYVQDIKDYLTKGEFIAFNQFMRGQTIAIINKKHVVYKHDYERWVEQDKYTNKMRKTQ